MSIDLASSSSGTARHIIVIANQSRRHRVLAIDVDRQQSAVGGAPLPHDPLAGLTLDDDPARIWR